MNVSAGLKASNEVTSEASQVVCEPGYGLFGSVSHSFTADSFTTLTTAAEANLTKGILEFWSQPDNRRQLIEVLSFSLEWWTNMKARVTAAALEFGCCWW